MANMNGPRGPMKPRDDGIPKPKHIKEVPAYLWKKVTSFTGRLLYVISLVWESAPWILFLMVLLCVLDGTLPVIGAYISSELLNAIADLIGRGLVKPSGIAEALSVFSGVLWLFLFQFLHMFLRRVITRVDGIVTTIAGELVSNHIKMKIITKAKTLDQQSFDQPQFYEKLENANREAGVRPIGILTATFSVVSAIISSVSFIVVLATLSPVAPLVIIVASIPGAIINYHYRNRNFRYMRFHSKERRELNYYSDLMTNKDYAKEIKILGLGDTFIDKYRATFRRYFAGIRSLAIKEGTTQLLVSILTVAVSCLLFLYVAYTIVYENGRIGDYSLYTGALTSIAGYVTTLVNATARIYEGTLFVDNMMTYMKEETTVIRKEVDLPAPVRGDAHVLELSHVSFCYPGSDTYVIRDVSLTLRSGERTVLVGLNGAGKTTLIKLIMRLYDPTEGTITLDGVDIREYDPIAYYKLFGIIFQDFGRYADTAANNIRFGDVDAPFTDADIESAAKHGGVYDYLNTLSDGLQTPLTRLFEEDGTELSGGQWQKLSIARAFYKKSDILIMDEPTAALDPLAEQEVFERFSALSKGKIAIFISHRLSGAVGADAIVVLEDGAVVEIGTHEELMAIEGRYHLLFTTQARRYTERDGSDVDTQPRLINFARRGPREPNFTETSDTLDLSARE